MVHIFSGLPHDTDTMGGGHFLPYIMAAHEVSSHMQTVRTVENSTVHMLERDGLCYFLSSALPLLTIDKTHFVNCHSGASGRR